MANTYIHLPYSQGEAMKGKHNDGFWSDAIKRHLAQQSSKGLPIGSRLKIEESRELDGLDILLRERYARYPETRQATNDVINALVETKDFEVRKAKNPKSNRDVDWIFLKAD